MLRDDPFDMIAGAVELHNDLICFGGYVRLLEWGQCRGLRWFEYDRRMRLGGAG
jgi:hypothetical protein